MEHRVYLDFNAKHVLIGKGKGIYNHPGTTRLRNRVNETFLGYDVADKAGKKSIATALVREVLSGGGQFQQVADGRFLNENEAILNVQRRYDQCRKKNKGNDGNAEGQDHLNQNDRDFLVFDHAADMDTKDFLKAIFEDECDAEKQRLLKRLTMVLDLDCDGMVVDRGEEISASLLSILDVAASDGTVDQLIYSDQMMAAFKSLVWSCKKSMSKRARRSNEGNPQPRDGDDHTLTKEVCSNEGSKSKKVSSVDSLLSAFESALQFKKDTYIDKLEIVGPRVFKKGESGEKEYFGTTMNGLPHGLGFMIYKNKKKWLWGHWRKGQLHGLGGAIYENSHRCFGLFVKEQLHGRALYMTDDSKYIGKYYKHRRHGPGKLIHDTKGTFEGHFREDRFEGKGKYTTINGDEIKGDFVNWDCVNQIP